MGIGTHSFVVLILDLFLAHTCEVHQYDAEIIESPVVYAPTHYARTNSTAYDEK